MGTKKFASFYVGIPIAERVVLNGCNPFLRRLCTLTDMTSLDENALFTNIALNEIIYICIKKLFQILETLVKGITKNDFRDLLNLATEESFFPFNNKYLYLTTSFIFR